MHIINKIRIPIVSGFLLLLGFAVLLSVSTVVLARSQAATVTAGAAGTNPPAKPMNLQASATHDKVTLSWTASTDQTVTHYAILHRNQAIDSLGIFHVL